MERILQLLVSKTSGFKSKGKGIGTYQTSQWIRILAFARVCEWISMRYTERCQGTGLEVPNNAFKVFSLALSAVCAVAKRGGITEEKNAAVVLRDSAVEEWETAQGKNFKLKANVGASAHRVGALEDRMLRLTADWDLLSRKLADSFVAAEGEVVADAELLRVRGARNEKEDK